MRFGKFIALATVFVAAFTLGSCSKDDDEVEPKEVVEDNPKYENREYVDLGLPSGTLWAACNVGANKPEEYGDYFAWGETQSKDIFSSMWENHKWCQEGHITKYHHTVDNKAELDAEDDAASVNWSSSWRMPSIDQIKELLNSDYTTYELTTQNDVYGLKITSKKNGKTLFLPACGYRTNEMLAGLGSGGAYWSRSLDADPGQNAWAFVMEFPNPDMKDGKPLKDYYRRALRFLGCNVRPVLIQK
jgi:hypothetical protein